MKKIEVNDRFVDLDSKIVDLESFFIDLIVELVVDLIVREFLKNLLWLLWLKSKS